MTPIAALADTATDAEQDARAAAAAAGIDIRVLDDLPGITASSNLFDTVWGGTDNTIMPVNLMRALSTAGGYVAGATLDGNLVGAIIGFVGLHDRQVVLHSHILGVLPQTRGRSVGFALKQHQRAWCLARGITSMMWTFDPLVRRNAFFNLSKLAAIGARYEPNFYGEMPDGINAGDETDRMVVEWRLADPAVAAAAQGQRTQRLDAHNAAVLLDVDNEGRPRTYDVHGDALRCRIPEDILTLRAERPELALRWRRALRDTLGAAVSDGYDAVDMDRAGWYLLTRSSGG